MGFHDYSTPYNARNYQFLQHPDFPNHVLVVTVESDNEIETQARFQALQEQVVKLQHVTKQEGTDLVLALKEPGHNIVSRHIDADHIAAGSSPIPMKKALLVTLLGHGLARSQFETVMGRKFQEIKGSPKTGETRGAG